jgi:hypothetical protein
MNEYNDRFSLLGYDTQSLIYNLGDLGILQFWIFFKLGLLLLFALISSTQCCTFCEKRNEKYSQKYKSEKVSIFYNWPIRFFFEAYLEFSVSTLIKLKGSALSTATFADTFDSALSCFYLALVFIAPLFHFIYFAINDERLRHDKGFYAKFNTVFMATKVDKIFTIYYNGFFMLRRLSFVLVCIYCDDELYIF